jgi:predicted transcriptional regulator
MYFQKTTRERMECALQIIAKRGEIPMAEIGKESNLSGKTLRYVVRCLMLDGKIIKKVNLVGDGRSHLYRLK